MALGYVLGRCVGAGHFHLHVIDLQGENRQAVESPRGAFGVDCRAVEGLYILVGFAEVGVELLNHVGAVLIGAVDATLQGQGGHRVDFGVAYDILKMPLHGIDPVLGEECVLDRAVLVGVVYLGVNIVMLVIESCSVVEYAVALVSKIHNHWGYCCY